MATLKDVAKLANVDVSTVSRALNNTSYVHPDTKKKIFKAVRAVKLSPKSAGERFETGEETDAWSSCTICESFSFW